MGNSVDDGGQRRWVADVIVLPKPGVNDPEGESILGGLRSLGYAGVTGVRAGRFLQVTFVAVDAEVAAQAVTEMCEQLLANPVIETYHVEIVEEVADAVDEPDGVSGGGDG